MSAVNQFDQPGLITSWHYVPGFFSFIIYSNYFTTNSTYVWAYISTKSNTSPLPVELKLKRVYDTYTLHYTTYVIVID